jgi:very-short-patch-repair endonuclease
MGDTKELVFRSMREACTYFKITYDPKNSGKNAENLSMYCSWERINKKHIKICDIYQYPKIRKSSKDRKPRDYIYQIGDTISSTNSSMVVLKQIRCTRERMAHGKKCTVYEKGYFVRCLKDNYEFELVEHSLAKNCGCPVCSNRKIIKGINDVATTNPEIASLFENIEDAYTTSYSTAKKFRFKCPICGFVKMDCTNNITCNGFSCPCCADGYSYPNKFMARLLFELNIDYDRERKFEWCKYPCYADRNKTDFGFYDFVIPSLNLIIEMDGALGHGNNVMTTVRHNRRKITVEETAYRDKMKDKLAQEHGYQVIRIQCIYNNVYERFAVVEENIRKSKLSKIFCFDSVNFLAVDKYCITSSYINDTSMLWNKGMSVLEIAIQLKLCPATIKNYLSIAKSHNMCNYTPNEAKLRGHKKSNARTPYLICYNGRKEIFSTLQEIVKYYQDHYDIKLNSSAIRTHANNCTCYYDRKFIKISKEEFNKYKSEGLADLVVGEAFLI